MTDHDINTSLYILKEIENNMEELSGLRERITVVVSGLEKNWIALRETERHFKERCIEDQKKKKK